jgi:hypothetical protein
MQKQQAQQDASTPVAAAAANQPSAEASAVSPSSTNTAPATAPALQQALKAVEAAVAALRALVEEGRAVGAQVQAHDHLLATFHEQEAVSARMMRAPPPDFGMYGDCFSVQ